MNPEAWKVIVAFAFGSAVGMGIRRALVAAFGGAGSAVSVSTVTVSSMLGGFCGAAVAWVMSSSAFLKEGQTLLMFVLLGVVLTSAADAAAAQASIAPHDRARLRSRAGLHVVIGIVSALLVITLIKCALAARW
jgi:hypothetical protein